MYTHTTYIYRQTHQYSHSYLWVIQSVQFTKPACLWTVGGNCKFVLSSYSYGDIGSSNFFSLLSLPLYVQTDVTKSHNFAKIKKKSLFPVSVQNVRLNEKGGKVHRAQEQLIKMMDNDLDLCHGHKTTIYNLRLCQNTTLL